MFKSHHENYKGFTIMRGAYGNGSYNVYSSIGHYIGNAESLNVARQIVDNYQGTKRQL